MNSDLSVNQKYPYLNFFLRTQQNSVNYNLSLKKKKFLGGHFRHSFFTCSHTEQKLNRDFIYLLNTNDVLFIW
jgi:hypothetical protein